MYTLISNFHQRIYIFEFCYFFSHLFFHLFPYLTDRKQSIIKIKKKSQYLIVAVAFIITIVERIKVYITS